MTPDFLAGYDKALDDARRWGWRRPDRFLVVAALVVGFVLGLAMAPALRAGSDQAVAPSSVESQSAGRQVLLGAPDTSGQRTVAARGAPEANSAASSGAPLTGTFSWHATGRHGAYAAACGAFREQVPNWRGQSVTVTGPAGSLALVVNDFCRNETRLLDLSVAAFQAVCGPLALGVCRGTVGGLRPPETDL